MTDRNRYGQAQDDQNKQIDFEKAVCEKLAENGMPVVGLDAQKY